METRKRRWIMITGMLGFVTLYVLTNLIDNLGMAYFAVALECYLLLDVLFSAWIPDCVEKLVRSRMVKEQYKNAEKVFKTAFFYALIVGMFGSLLLYLCAEVLCGKIFAAKEAALALKILSPVFALNAIAVVLQGYFQGLGTAMPTVVSGVLRQVLGLSFGALFGTILSSYGKKAAALLHNETFAFMYGAAGVAVGFLLAGLLTVLFLLLVYLGAGRRAHRRSREGMRLSEDSIEILRGLMVMMLPMAAIGLLMRAGTLFGLWIYQSAPGEEAVSIASFGGFYGKFLMVAGFVTLLALICCAGVETTVVHSIKKEEYKNAKTYLSGGMQSVWILTLFFAAVGFVLAPCFVSETEIAACMKHGAFLPAFLAMGIFFSHVLYAIYKKKTVLLSLLAAFGGFLVTAIAGVQLSKGNIVILVYAWQVFAVIFCLANGFILFKSIRLNPEWLRMVVLPLFVAFVSGICMFFLSGALRSVLGGTLTGLICLVAGGLCYTLLLFVFRCIREKDLYVLPGGIILQKAGRFLHLL